MTSTLNAILSGDKAENFGLITSSTDLAEIAQAFVDVIATVSQSKGDEYGRKLDNILANSGEHTHMGKHCVRCTHVHRQQQIAFLLNSKLIPMMHAIAPVGGFFGLHPDSETDFGFWFNGTAEMDAELAGSSDGPSDAELQNHPKAKR
jgi:4-hydroxyphenylpyruvate dioxygenase-like putative hemolysin